MNNKRMSLSKHIYFVLLFSFLLLGSAKAQEPLTLWIHPYLPARELVKRFTPLTTYLTKKINRPINIRISKSYQAHIDRVGQDKVDLAYMGPAPYVKMSRKYGTKPLLARLEVQGSPTFHGIIMVRANSNIKTLSDLRGKRFAFGNPNSTMSHLVPRYVLQQADVKVDSLARYKFLATHHDVALAVLSDLYDAGAVKEAVFTKYQERGLRILATTPAISEHLFLTSKQLETDTLAALQQAFTEIQESRNEHRLISSIKKLATGLVPVQDTDYDNLRHILNTLHALGVGTP